MIEIESGQRKITESKILIFLNDTDKHLAKAIKTQITSIKIKQGKSPGGVVA